MLATCRSNTLASLSDHQLGRFQTSKEPFEVTPGRKYAVFAMGIWETTLYFLIKDDLGRPNLVPAGLFQSVGQRIPSGWRFGLEEGMYLSGRDAWTTWVAKWGYPEFVLDTKHSDGLLERDEQAIDVFNQYSDQEP